MKKTIICIIWVFSFLVSNGQQGMWTWIHGSNTPGSTGVFGTMGVASAAHTPPSLYQPCGWTDLQGQFWIYGGDSPLGLSAALWKYNPSKNMWTWVHGPSTLNSNPVYGTKGVAAISNSPGSRRAGIASWIDKQGNLWLFGGSSPTNTIFNDLWKYDITSNMWTWMSGSNIPNDPGSYGTMGISSPTNSPPCRNKSNLTWVDSIGNLWLFGGETYCGGGLLGDLNDLWKYDVLINEWTWVRGDNTCNSLGSYGTVGLASPTNDPPAGSRLYAKWQDQNGDFWFNGGGAYGTYLNDLWKYNVASNQWTCIRPSQPNEVIGAACISNQNYQPQGRVDAATCWVDQCDNFWMFGGASNGYFNDLWSYNPQKNEWAFVNGKISGSYGAQGIPNSNNQPPELCGAIALSNHSDSLWFFGGFNGLGYYNALWRYVIDTSCVGGCVLAQQNPTAGFTATNTIGCSPLVVNFTNTSMNATSWSWDFGDGNTSSAQNPINTYTTPGQYSVTLTSINANGNDNISAINYVTVYNTPTAVVSNGVLIDAGASTQLNANGGGSYNWFPSSSLSCDTCANPIASPAVTTTYCVEVKDISGCSDTSCLTVTVRVPCPNNFKDVEVPNVFTPNNDGNNDVFYLEGWDLCIETFEMTIYNRWGIKIFESTSSNVEWDGRITSGVEAIEGTYYCIFNIKNLNGEQEVFSKFITLVR